jgi:hypothetical protein
MSGPRGRVIGLAAESPELDSQYFAVTLPIFPKKTHLAVVCLHLEEEMFIVAIAPESMKSGCWWCAWVKSNRLLATDKQHQATALRRLLLAGQCQRYALAL